MSRSGLCCFLAKRQENERKRPAQQHARSPAEQTSLNATGCKAYSPPGRQVEQEKSQKRCHPSCASSSSICTQSCPPCPGEKSPRFATFGMAEGQIIRVSNIWRPLALLLAFRPDATNPGI